MQTDFLIIGQGLAGSLLAWELIRRNCEVIVVDTGKANASLVAAGIINPITGIRLVKTTDVDILLPAAHNCYNQLSSIIGQPFYFEKPMYRIVKDEAERVRCTKRQTQAEYRHYLDDFFQPDQQIAGFSTPFGYIEQLQTGHLMTVPLLSKMKQFFIEREGYRQTYFDYQALQMDCAVHWQGLTTKQVIFCEGYSAYQNPWFSWLPFQPAKGEILTLEHEIGLPNAILNYGHWLLPLSTNKMRVGATFDRAQIDTQCSEYGKQSLLDSLNAYSPPLAKANMTAHQAGIRPCTLDKNPYIGRHPHNERISIFNGFGAKGSLQIPWYSQRFADYLLNNIPLPVSCDIQRYQADYFPG